MGKSVAALEIGTSKIVCAAARRNPVSTFTISGFGQAEYKGIKKGKFLVEQEALQASIDQAVTAAENMAEEHIREVIVGVPGCFCKLDVFDNQIYLEEEEIRAEHMEEVVNNLRQDRVPKEYKLINAMPAYFILDDKGMYLDPEGMQSRFLHAKVSYILAKKQFLKKIRSALDELGISVSVYLPDFYAEALYCIPPYVRDEIAILLDIGYYDTNLCVVCADAVIQHENIPIGGAHIAHDLGVVLKIDEQASETIKRRYTFGMEFVADKNFEYVKDKQGKVHKISLELIQKIIDARVEQLTDIIYNKLNECILPIPEKSTVYLTGGGIAMMRGVREYLSKGLQRNVKLIRPTNVPYDGANYTAITSMIHTVLSQAENEHNSHFFHNIKNLVKRK